MFLVCVIIIIIERKVVGNCEWFLFGHGWDKLKSDRWIVVECMGTLSCYAVHQSLYESVLIIMPHPFFCCHFLSLQFILEFVGLNIFNLVN